MATTRIDVPATAARPQYTCLIRLPFPRGDFVDPPPVDWDTTKDAALWKLISKAANSKDLNWPELSNKFQVSLPFLLQQAAWLYERHFAQMRAQMKKLGTSNSSSPVPAQDGIGSIPPGSSQQQRPGSRQSRAPSALSMHSRDSPQLPSGSITSSARANAPTTISRTPSTRTVTQSRLAMPTSPRDGQPARSFRSSFGSHRKPIVLENINAEDSSSPPIVSSSSTLSSSDEDAPIHPSVAKSQVFRRPPDLRTISSDGDAEDDEDDDSSAGYLPFASRHDDDVPVIGHSNKDTGRPASRDTDPAATLRTGSGAKTADHTPQLRQEVLSSTSSAESAPHVRRVPLASSQSSANAPTYRTTKTFGPAAGPSRMSRTQSTPGQSAAKAAMPGNVGDKRSGGQLQGPGALSPKHRAELGRLSGRTSKEGSEGTPSMGSSFSDLDDASVTQSALEDALLSNMQHGNIASRMSTFSQALRSKYLPQ
ncbi:hypothetical protein BDZ85DRAFT_280476 [Elsinoe ampelina]|uniref:Autophagy-related protein 29 n=1 Tax=Elsinoe ampelina TaxID=302913 RepID=A0A6A6GHV7_9PEZI|nr:hypothetical protein BDZ85DRAFT_280476 [Elsinoe ampelina]